MADSKYNWMHMKEIREKLLKENSSIYMTADMLGPDIDSISKKQFSIFVEDEGNKVFILIQSVSGNIVTEEDIYAELKSRGIVIGIKHDVITEIIKKRKRNEKILIAEGIPAKDGKNVFGEIIHANHGTEKKPLKGKGFIIDSDGVTFMANYIMNSNISTMGKVIVSGSKGVLLGDKICVVKGVDTYNL